MGYITYSGSGSDDKMRWLSDCWYDILAYVRVAVGASSLYRAGWNELQDHVEKWAKTIGRPQRRAKLTELRHHIEAWTDDIFKCISLSENVCIFFIEIPLKVVPTDQTDYESALVQVTDCRLFRRQAISWATADLLLHIRTNFSGDLFKIKNFSVKKMYLKLPSAKGSHFVKDSIVFQNSVASCRVFTTDHSGGHQ